MIIVRTPFRVSFFGGGTDYPVWFHEQPGAVLATTIDKYCYISVRPLPPFFGHTSRIVWSHNFRPGGARIFLGDGGAGFIGFTLAGLAVMGEWAQNGLVGLVTPTLILGVPLFDIAFVGVVRVVTGKVHTLREWLAYTGRDHIHHRFEALGFTRAQSVFLIFSISTILGLSAMLLENAAPRQAVVVLLQAVCVLMIIAVVESVGRGRLR